MISPIPTRAHVESRLRSLRGDLSELGVKRLALFGSVARDEASPDSDIDVLVEFQPGAKSFDRFMALADLLENTLGHAVELVTPESLSPYLAPHILSNARDVVRAREFLRHIVVAPLPATGFSAS